MELRYVRSFVMVAETQSFSAAAVRCCVTQSAISQHIKLLEQELNCQLLVRTPHRFRLTESGELLLVRAREMLRQEADCKEQIDALNNCMAGELHIGIGSFIAPYIRHAITLFMERYPGVRICCEYNQACRLNEALRAHRIDMAFTMNMSYQHENIHSMPCIPFLLHAFMRDTHPLARKDKVSYEDVMRFPVIMPDVGDRVFQSIQKFTAHDLSKLHVRCVIGDPDEALAVVEDTTFVTFLPKLYLRHHPALSAKPIIGLEQSLMSNVHWMKDVPMKRSMQILLDIIKEESIPYVSSSERMV